MVHGEPFSFDKAHRLHGEDRLRYQPVGQAIDALELTGSETVIDLGAGTGFYTIPIAKRLAEGKPPGVVLSMDVEPRMLELLHSRATAAGVEDYVTTVKLGGAQDPRLPGEPGSVDRVILSSVYHELPQRPATLGGLYRLVKPDGIIVIVDWDPEQKTKAGPPLIHRVSYTELAADLRNAGFEGVERLKDSGGQYQVRAWRGQDIL